MKSSGGMWPERSTADSPRQSRRALMAKARVHTCAPSSTVTEGTGHTLKQSCAGPERCAADTPAISSASFPARDHCSRKGMPMVRSVGAHTFASDGYTKPAVENGLDDLGAAHPPTARSFEMDQTVVRRLTGLRFRRCYGSTTENVLHIRLLGSRPQRL